LYSAPLPATYFGGLTTLPATYLPIDLTALTPRAVDVPAPAIGEMQPIYVINGFYMAMREKYTKADASISYMLVEWDSAKLSWADFRGKVLGGTDPTGAEAGSLRRQIYEQWKDLGLKSEPNVGDNGVHASASPFEAMAERMNWVGAKLDEDEFAKALTGAGVDAFMIQDWTKDPQVEFEGKKGSLFDLLEDLDAKDCLEKAQKIAGVTGPATLTKNSAFVFVKPHAVTDAVVTLVKEGFAKAGITITSSGTLDGKTIEEKLLIDNHYYAIANKASLSKPAELNPPAAKQEEFEKLFGEKWEDALKDGKVFNAVDACTHLGMDGIGMDKAWAAAKKDDKLVKFGGGFYAGLVTPRKKREPLTDEEKAERRKAEKEKRKAKQEAKKEAKKEEAAKLKEAAASGKLEAPEGAAPKLSVAGITAGTTSAAVTDLFNKHGLVLRAEVSKRNKSKPTATVIFNTHQDVRRAFKALHGKHTIEGASDPISIQYANDSPKWGAVVKETTDGIAECLKKHSYKATILKPNSAKDFINRQIFQCKTVAPTEVLTAALLVMAKDATPADLVSCKMIDSEGPVKSLLRRDEKAVATAPKAEKPEKAEKAAEPPKPKALALTFDAVLEKLDKLERERWNRMARENLKLKERQRFRFGDLLATPALELWRWMAEDCGLWPAEVATCFHILQTHYGYKH